MCNIRRIQPDDWQQYKALRLEAVRLHPEAFSATYDDQLAKTDTDWQVRVLNCATAPDNVILVADNQYQLVGMMGLYRETGKRSHVAIIWGVYVQADYRRQQLGCQLMQETPALARRMEGVRKVRLDVNAIKIGRAHV